MSFLRVRIIVLNYNGAEILPLCLPSIVEACRHASFPTAITLLDNRSTDQSVTWVESRLPEIQIARAKENRFLVSFNDYVSEVDEDIVILLNSDVRADPDFVDPLIQVFQEHQDAFLASPQSFSFDGKQPEGGRTRAKVRWGIFWSSAHFPECEKLRDSPGYTFASGFGAFHRKRFLALGGYDDLYLPGILEDADLGFRAWREGYRSYYVPESRVYHMGQASFQKAFGRKGVLSLAHRNTFLFMWKNISDPAILMEHFFLLLPRLVYALSRGQMEFITGFFRALLRFQEAWRRRRFPLKRARGDREIFSLANGSFPHPSYVFKKRWKRLAMGIFDFLGSVLFFSLNLFRKKPLIAPQRILIVRIDSLGDAVLTLPAIQALASRFPKAQIDFLAGPAVHELYASIFPHSKIILSEKNWFNKTETLGGALSEFLSIVKKLRAFRYDLAIDFRGDLRTILLLSLAKIPHRWGRSGTGGGFLLTHRLLNPYQRHEILENLELVKEDKGRPQVEFPSLGFLSIRAGNSTGRKIVIHVGAGYPSKRWATSNFVEVAKRIHDKRLGTPVFIGQSEEKILLDPYRNERNDDFLDLTGKTSLSELLTLLSQADLYIGNDSGPAHLAALLDRKIVLIFSGTNDFKRWAPCSSKLRLLHHPVPCSPCEERVCPLSRQICLEDISVEEVFCAVEKALSD